MPTYEITAPDGKVLEITAPEGATQDQVLAYAQAQYKPQKADFAGVRGGSLSTEPRAERDSSGRLTDFGRRVQAQRVADRDTYSPTSSFGGNMLAGIGKSFVDTATGVRQAATDAMGRTATIGSVLLNRSGLDGAARAVASGVAEPLRQSSDRQAEALAERRRVEEPLMSTGGGITGNVAGTLAQLLGPGIIARGSLAGSMLLPATVGGNSLQGGVIGAIQPAESGGERALNTGAGLAFGVLGAAAPHIARATARPARNALDAMLGRPTASGVERKAGEMIAAEAGDLGRLLQPNPSAVPGAQRTLAEESLDPGIARLERQARGQSNAFVPLDQANAAARAGAVERIAGTDADMAAAIAARSTAANPIRREAMQIEGVDTNRLLSQIDRLARAQEGRPAVQEGMQKIRSLLTREIPDAERMKAAIKPLQDFIDSDRLSVANREAAKAAIAQIKAGEWPVTTFTTGSAGSIGGGQSHAAAREALARARKALERTSVGHDKVAVLDNVRKTIGDMLSGKYGGESAAALAGSRELMAIKNQLDRVLEKQAPQYGQYIEAFRAGSVPINRMQVGRELLDRGAGGAIPDPVTGVRPLTPAAFGRQVNDLDAMAARATGFGKARAEQILTPQDIATLRAIQDDLSRQNFRATAGSGGNSMTQERQALANRLGRDAAKSLPIVGRFVESLEASGERRLNETLARLLANPDEARRVLATLNPQDRAVVSRALAQLSASSGAMAPALAE